MIQAKTRLSLSALGTYAKAGVLPKQNAEPVPHHQGHLDLRRGRYAESPTDKVGAKDVGQDRSRQAPLTAEAL